MRLAGSETRQEFRLAWQEPKVLPTFATQLIPPNGPNYIPLRDRMSDPSYTDQQLQAYLDETLSSELMSSIERDLRGQTQLRERLIDLAGLREAGVHGLGEIWRRNRVSCPNREQLGSFILGAIDSELQAYIRFHLDEVGCRLCDANLQDLQGQRTEQLQATQIRRRRYFQTSAGYLSQHKSGKK